MARIVAVEANRPHEGAIQALEEALDLARRGELRSVAIVADMATGNRFYTNYGFENGPQLIGHLYTLTASVERKMTGGG